MSEANIFAFLNLGLEGIKPQAGFFMPLLVGHLLGDFPLQPASWVDERRRGVWRSSRLYLHALVSGLLAGLAACLTAGTWRVAWVCPLVFLTHALLDGVKSHVADTVRAFLLDQLAHLIVLAALAWLLVGSGEAPVNGHSALWPLAACFLVLWWAAGIFIEKATSRWRGQLGVKDRERLQDAGLWIGRLERMLIFLFVLLQRYEAI